MATKTETAAFETTFLKALAAGRKAAFEAEKTLATYAITGSGKFYGTMRGTCGFGWVIVKHRKFGFWLKKMGHGRADHYYGGVCIWIGEHGQSYEMKEAHAYAMAKVFEEAGFSAYGAGRMD